MEEEKRKDGPYVGSQQFFGSQNEKFRDLSVLGKILGYKEPIILVLKGEEERLARKYPGVYDTIQNCKYVKDKRTPFEYTQDLVASWLFEDFLVIRSNEYAEKTNEGFHLELAGRDKKREILPQCKIKGTSDCLFTYNGIKLPVEIITDYTGYFQRCKKVDLRNNKYENLITSKSVVVGISTIDTTYILLDFTTPDKIPTAYKHKHFQWGNKMVSTIDFEPNGVEIYQFNVLKVMNQLMEITRRMK